MISPKLYKSSRTYDFFMKSLGFESSIDRCLRSLPIGCADDCRILDAGCGTGVLGLHFLERFPRATLQATDLEPNFLAATINNASRRGIDPERITTSVADISTPALLTTLEGVKSTLPDESFDLICIGAVVGYASDTESSIRQLVNLLAPGGYLINIEMNEKLAGRFVSRRYHYNNISLKRLSQVLRDEGCEVSTTALRMSHLPARLTRTTIVAHKA